MRGKLLDRPFHLVAQLVPSDKGNEVQRLIERLGRQLAYPPPPPALAPALCRFDGLFDRDGNSPLQLSLAATPTRTFGGHIKAAFVGRLIALFPFGFLYGLAAPRPAHRSAGGKDPAHSGDRLPPDQTAFVEKPLVLAVELLERVVGQHDGPDLVGDSEQESVASAYRPRRRANDLCSRFRLFEKLPLLRGDAVAERSIYDDGDNVVWVLNEELAYRLVELFECRQRTAFRRNIRAVDDYVTSWHFSPVLSSKRSHPRTGSRRACSPSRGLLGPLAQCHCRLTATANGGRSSPTQCRSGNSDMHLLRTVCHPERLAWRIPTLRAGQEGLVMPEPAPYEPSALSRMSACSRS